MGSACGAPGPSLCSLRSLASPPHSPALWQQIGRVGGVRADRGPQLSSLTWDPGMVLCVRKVGCSVGVTEWRFLRWQSPGLWGGPTCSEV